MLSKLCAENVAVIEKAEIDLENGFNVFTGETGAGKSILVDAICAVLGARTSKSIVRTGESKARVTAVFDNLSEEVLEKLQKKVFTQMITSVFYIVK
jgi:DNA repair protein RecN (Recombination protein N)